MRQSPCLTFAAAIRCLCSDTLYVDTTRKPKLGEVEGVDYNYITVEEFQDSIEAGEFIEFGQQGDVYYGSKK